ncbi:hypothetical protein QTP86_012918 [Hemibagrus guttatus]|nr:hypothetical protein QTP86_012918 [Hemibagrus guttatus]
MAPCRTMIARNSAGSEMGEVFCDGCPPEAVEVGSMCRSSAQTTVVSAAITLQPIRFENFRALCASISTSTMSLFLLLCLTVAMQTFRHDYYMITTPSTWADANAYCKSKYLNLATVRTDDDWYRLNAAAESKGLAATGWVGLFLDVYDWYWSNTVVYLMTTASYWAPGQPDNLGGNEECCAIDSTGSWADYPCTDLKPFICFNAATGAIFPYTSPMTWSGSQIHCQTYHTDLARAITSTQNKYKEIYLVLKLQIQGDESVFDPVVQSAVLQQLAYVNQRIGM